MPKHLTTTRISLAAGTALLALAASALPALAMPGDLYVSNFNSNTIERFTPGGAASVFATGLSFPVALAFDASGNLYAANLDTNTIEQFTPGGAASVFATGLNNTDALAFDASGNLYVGNFSTIERLTPGGVVSVFASTGLSGAFGLAFEPAIAPPSSAVPEPASAALLALGLGWLGAFRRRTA